MLEQESNSYPKRGESEQRQIDRFNLKSLRAQPIFAFNIDLLRERLSNGNRTLIAVDLGGSKATSATITLGPDFTSDITDVKTLQARNGEGYLRFLEEIGRKAFELSTPVGISTTGIVEKQRLIRTTHLPNLLNDLREFDGDLLKVIPTLKSVANDAVAGSIGSYMEALRQFPNTKQVIYLINGSGLGAAVFKDSFIWSMEPGHVEAVSEFNPYDQKEICTLTNVPTSCIHTLTSGIGMENLYLKRTGEKIDGEELARRLSRGDKLAADLYQNSARLTAATIGGIESAFGIATSRDTTIVCHGGTFNVDRYREYVLELLQDGLISKPQIIFTKNFSQNACLDGAALAAIMS